MRGLWRRRLAGQERGMAMLYVVVLTPLMAIITTGIIMAVAADSGFRQLQAVKTLAVAEGGLHHALAKLQGAGAPTYAGETVPIVDGGTSLGSAAVTVSCLDGVPLPCTGVYANYRRIVAQGQITANGPQRILSATVESTASSGISVCAGSSFTASPGTNSSNPTRLYTDVGSNGTINLQGTGNVASEIRADPPAGPYANLGYYTGSAKAKGAITCDGSCNQHVQGTVSANLGTNVCAMPALPTFSPQSGNNANVSQGTTMVWNPAVRYDQIQVANGTTGGGFGIQSPCSSFTTLTLPAGAAGTTTVFHARKLHLDTCSRLMVTGAGNVELRLAETSSEALEGQLHARIGVTAADSPLVPAPLPAGQLKIITPSTSQGQGASALDFDGSAIISAVLMAPNGGITYEPTGAANSKWYGALVANDIRIGSGVVFTYDPSVAPVMGWAGTSFGKLRTWKDQ